LIFKIEKMIDFKGYILVMRKPCICIKRRHESTRTNQRPTRAQDPKPLTRRQGTSSDTTAQALVAAAKHQGARNGCKQIKIN
jgi:hypothetical protein